MKDEVLVDVLDIQVILENQLILTDVSLTLARGDIVTLIGPNGAGKTTLIHVILGFLKPSRGRVISRPGIRIGYMPQKIHIDPAFPLSVERFLKLSPASNGGRVKEVLEMVRAYGLLRQPLRGLSGGEMQRVLLAKALMTRPHLLVLDEPLQAVDLPGQSEFYALMEDIRRRFQCSILLVSHDLHWVFESSDRVICLNKHICCEGAPVNVASDPRYQKLFGTPPLKRVMPYQHVHDHTHDGPPDGEIPF